MKPTIVTGRPVKLRFEYYFQFLDVECNITTRNDKYYDEFDVVSCLDSDGCEIVVVPDLEAEIEERLENNEWKEY